MRTEYHFYKKREPSKNNNDEVIHHLRKTGWFLVRNGEMLLAPPKNSPQEGIVRIKGMRNE